LPSGQEKGEERIGDTVEPFDEPGGDFRRNPRKSGLPDLRSIGCRTRASPSSVGRGSF